MAINNSALASMSTKQKVILGVIAVLAIFMLWQLIAMLRGNGSTPPPQVTGPRPAATAKSPQQGPTLQEATLSTDSMTTAQQMELMRMQQETQAKYVVALNELQMLKLSKQIAETNKDIASARLATVTAQKGLVDLLSKPTIPESQIPYGQGLVNSGSVQPVIQPISSQPAPVASQQEMSYTVVSVSQLQGRWSAVVGAQGKLYHVYVGDVLPADGSTVISIDKTGITLSKEGGQKRVSLVPII